jgi:hypothetical protein
MPERAARSRRHRPVTADDALKLDNNDPPWYNTAARLETQLGLQRSGAARLGCSSCRVRYNLPVSTFHVIRSVTTKPHQRGNSHTTAPAQTILTMGRQLTVP